MPTTVKKNSNDTTVVVNEREARYTFTTQFTEVSRVKTRIQEQAFKLSLPCSFEEIGGFTEQTVGVVIRSHDEGAMKKFDEWYNASIQDVLAPQGWLGLVIKEHL